MSDRRRDSPLENTDSVQIILDTYRDTQNGFVFGTNPSGLEYDGQVAYEGAGSGNFAGGGRQQRVEAFQVGLADLGAEWLVPSFGLHARLPEQARAGRRQGDERSYAGRWP